MGIVKSTVSRAITILFISSLELKLLRGKIHKNHFARMKNHFAVDRIKSIVK